MQTLTIKATETNYKLLETNKLNKVRIFGVKKEPKSISVGSEVHSEFVYNIITKVKFIFKILVNFLLK